MEVVFTLPNMDQVEVQRGIVYKSTDKRDLTLDLYSPPLEHIKGNLPLVIFVLGYPDWKLKDMQSYISWGKLVAAKGMIGVNYETTDPETDLVDLISYLRRNADQLQIDSNRIGIWSCSGNVPVAQAYLQKEFQPYLKFGVFYYGLMSTPDNKLRTAHDSLSASYGFVSPEIEENDQLSKDLPLMIVRSGQDNIPYINHSINYFMTWAISENLPVTLINYTEGQHAFDIRDNTAESRRIIKQTLLFMKEKMLQEN